MMKKKIALVLITINLVFFGLTVAQNQILPYPYPGQSSCPRDIQACVDMLGAYAIISPETLSQCCPLLQARLDASLASVCICNTRRIPIREILYYIQRVNRIFYICRILPPPGFICRFLLTSN
ncbi:hypothetical protein CARUB_v10007630mg [Capsella rubella]|uniref:Hydrophobic seed protein domain-containing protein n=1 Tax=Capsella rubella TaxID=81985 RepID=R0H2W5_9BRAS|nr:hypothetical protein CARUB_v10007630mg [Capsella rubella]